MNYENMTYSEIADAADYAEARMHFNNDNCGQAENPLDFSAPVADDDFEDFQAEMSDWYALAHPGALM